MRVFRFRFFVAALAPLSATWIGAAPAYAQDSAQDIEDVFEIEEILVTARRREESLRRVPASISALTGEGLEDIGATSFADYAGSVPGLLFQDWQLGSAGRGQQAVIRGVTTGLGSSLFSQSTVAIYLDDIPLATFFDPEVAGIERVEILRGPQGTLYGDRSMGGAIKYITADPSLDKFYGSVEARLAQTEHADDLSYRVSGMLNTPLSDKAALLLVGAYNDRAGYVDSDGSDPLDLVDSVYVKEGHNTREVTQLRAKLLFEATDDLSFVLSGYYEDNDIGGSSYYDPAKSDLTTTALFAPDGNSRETRAGNLRVEYDLGWASLFSSTSYLEDDTAIILPLTAGFQPFVEFVAGLVAQEPVDFRDPFRTDERANADTFTQEIRLSSNSDGAFNYLFGLFYTDGDTEGSAPAIQPGLAPFNTPTAALFGLTGNGTDVAFDFSGSGEFEELAGFGELRFDMLDEKLQATVGGRFFDVENKGFGPDGSETASSSETDSIFRGSLAWFPNEFLTVFGQVAQGYRSGGGNTTIPDPPANFADAFDADTLTNYEVGLKARTPGGKLTANLSAFYIDWDDIQTQFLSPGGFLYVANAGSAETRGVELEFASNPFDRVLLSGSLAYLKAEIAEDVPGAGLVDGDRLPGTPEWTASLNARTQFDIGSNYVLEPSIFWTYRDESFAQFGATQGQALESYSRTNLALVLRNAEAGWDLRLFADNVTDEAPTLAFYGFRSVPQVVTIRPRTVGLALTVDFD